MTPVAQAVRSGLARLWLPGWLFLVVAVYPIPHTIALRNLLLLGGVVVLLLGLRRRPQPFGGLGEARGIGLALAVLTAWLVVQSAVLGLEPRESLLDFKGDWLVALIVAFIGMLAALAVRRDTDRARRVPLLVAAATAGWLIHVLWFLGFQAWHGLRDGALLLGQTPFAQKDYHSVIANFALAVLLAEAVARAALGRRCLPWPTPWLAAALLATGLATAMLLARNGVAVAVALLAAAAAAYFAAGVRSPRALAGLTAAALLAAGLVAWSVQSDARWRGFIGSVRVATDIDAHRFWLDPAHNAPPSLPGGQPVEESAYLRMAWATAALREIGRHPLGVGYGHPAFGRAVNDHYGLKTGIQSSHSGLLDFTVANGVPGIVLWLALAALLMRLGWRSFRAGRAEGLMLFLFAFGYLVRCALDGHLSGWPLETYALAAGLLTALAARAPTAESMR